MLKEDCSFVVQQLHTPGININLLFSMPNQFIINAAVRCTTFEYCHMAEKQQKKLRLSNTTGHIKKKQVCIEQPNITDGFLGCYFEGFKLLK